MKHFRALIWLFGALPVFSADVSVFSTDVSYVVLNGRAAGSLVRISADGSSFQQIANVSYGTGLATDSHGDYLVTTMDRPGPGSQSALYRISRVGAVSKVIDGPLESNWVAVATDAADNVFLADNRTHSIWRVSSAGLVLTRIASYPVTVLRQMEDVGFVAEENDGFTISLDVGPHSLFKLDANGSLAARPPGGDELLGGRIVSDGNGGYFLANFHLGGIYQLTANGRVRKVAAIPGHNLSGLTRNPQTGELVAAVNFTNTLWRISPDGRADGKMVRPLVSGKPFVRYPVGVIAELPN
jgi:hypothetical protein